MEPRSWDVLIVDDDPSTRLLLEGEVRRTLPYVRVITAGSGEEAIACYQQQPADVLLIDLHMPGLDGAETLSRLRVDRDPGPVAVLMSGSPTGQRVAETSRADLFVRKPFDPDRLSDAIRRAAELAAARAAGDR